jgi:hypothetical protein
MNKTLSIILLLLANATFAQTEYSIDDFSDTYFAKVIIDKKYSNEIFKKGTVVVLTKKNKKKLFSVHTEEFVIDEANKKSSCVSYPYGKQNVLVYQDFNFDGQKDFAVQDGQHSCYHGPSYKIFLKNGATFTLSKEFTKLVQGPYCGMFEINSTKKQLTTHYKSGCCIHSTTTYTIKNNIPKPILIITEEYAPDTHIKTVTTKKWKNGKMVSSVRKVKMD